MNHFDEVFSVSGRRTPNYPGTLFSTPSNTVPHNVRDIRVIVERSFIGTVGIGNVVSSGHDTFVTEPLDATLVVPFRGKVTSVPENGPKQEAEPGGALLFSPNRRATRVEPHGASTFIGIPIMVPLRELRETAIELGASRSGVSALDDFSLSTLAGHAEEASDLVDGAVALRERLIRGDAKLLRDDVQRALSRTICETIVGLFQSTGAIRLPDHTDSRSAHRHVRNAVGFMREHYPDITTMTEVAAACGISSRTLEVAFRQVWSVRPHRILVAIRLEEVRRVLVQSDREDSITRIALAAGFSHLGRFALEYRARYGEKPSYTLRAFNAA